MDREKVKDIVDEELKPILQVVKGLAIAVFLLAAAIVSVNLSLRGY